MSDRPNNSESVSLPVLKPLVKRGKGGGQWVALSVGSGLRGLGLLFRMA
jgi:hypothetical protein